MYVWCIQIYTTVKLEILVSKFRFCVHSCFCVLDTLCQVSFFLETEWMSAILSSHFHILCWLLFSVWQRRILKKGQRYRNDGTQDSWINFVLLWTLTWQRLNISIIGRAVLCFNKCGYLIYAYLFFILIKQLHYCHWMSHHTSFLFFLKWFKFTQF